MPYPVLIDGDSISKPYGGLDDLPASFFVDRNGTVVGGGSGIDFEGRDRSQYQEGAGGVKAAFSH